MEDEINFYLSSLAKAFDAFLGGNFMRCKICEHVIEEKDNKYTHRLKYYDTLHEPSLEIDGLTKQNLDTALDSIKENSNQQIPSIYGTQILAEEEVELLSPFEVFGSNDEIALPKRMEKISMALKQYYGDDWLNIRNSKQPGLGK